MRSMVIRFTPEECNALELMAQHELRPVKDELRVLVRTEAERRGLWPELSPVVKELTPAPGSLVIEQTETQA